MAYKPKVTVVTVCFNAAETIEKTILSVIGQTYDNIEYLIIDGGSKDDTLAIIKKYEKSISKWISEPDKGIYDAMNKAIKMATGEWINFMNAGDCFASENVLADVFKEDLSENIKFLYSDNYYIELDGKKTYAKHDHNSLSILHQSSIYRKSLHTEHGFYIVTPRIIVSDLLFFASIPQAEFKKVDVPISCNSIDGVSASGWCITQALCTKVVFRKMSFMAMVLHMVSAHTKRILSNIKKI